MDRPLLETVGVSPKTTQLLRVVGWWAFWLWAPVPVVLIGLLLSGHLLTLPAPEPARLKVEGSGWRALHVLALKCACSRQVIDHLTARGAVAGFSEKLLLIGDDAQIAARVRAAGFAFESIDSKALEARYGIKGAPLLVVVSPADDVRYSGGYSPNKRGPPQDLAIFAALQGGQPTAALPLFGCAVSKALQAQVDPLGLTYSSSNP